LPVSPADLAAAAWRVGEQDSYAPIGRQASADLKLGPSFDRFKGSAPGVA